MYKLHESRHDIFIAAQAVEKSLVNIKNGVAGAKPPYRSSAICATASVH